MCTISVSSNYLCFLFFQTFSNVTYLRIRTGYSRESYSRGSPLPGVLDPTSDLLRRPIVELKRRNILALVPSRYEIIWRSYELSRFFHKVKSNYCLQSHLFLLTGIIFPLL